MTCTVDRRNRARTVAGVVEQRDPVVAATVVAPAESQYDAWTVDVVLDAEGLPPAVCDDAAHYSLTVRDVSPQGPQARAALVF